MNRPLRENGLRDVTNATVSNVALSTTTDLPPSFLEEDLSPERITWIIVGTIVVFAVALFLLSRLKYVKYLYCTKTCVEDVMRSWYNTLADGCMMCLRSVGLVSSDLHLYYGSGFDLTTQEEEADFYGENRSNLPSDNLDIHYGGKNNANLRSTYLEDDEDGGGLGQNGKKANSRSGFGGLFGDRGKGSKGGPQVPRTPPSRRSPDSHTIELSTIHHNFSSSSSRNESTVRSPMTAGYTVSGVNSFGVVHNSRLPTDMYRPVGDDIDDIGDFSPIVSAGNSTHNNNNSCSNNNNMYDSTDYESYVV